jgi:mannan endo-1,4-beta-mannosidase
MYLLPGCVGTGDGGGPSSDGSGTTVPGYMPDDGAQPTDDDPVDPAAPASGGMEAGENVQGLDPGTIDDGTTGDDLPLAGNGLLINGTCVPVCMSDATDPDAMGMRDGWGWENEASCLVTGLAPASQAMPCERAAAPMLPPPIIPGENVQRPEGVQSSGFFVSGGRLFDALGNDFIIRGINNPLAWFQNRNTGALAWTEQIASTGANTVRLVWEADLTGQNQLNLLRDAIQRSIDFDMVPMVELHDVTGGTNADDPARMARYYAETAAVRQILLDYEDYLLVNIANEWDGANNIYVESYTRAINVMRDAGLNHTLVIDANGYGQNANTVIAQGQTLLAADPQHNLLFSTHMYQNFRNAQTIVDTLQRARDAQVPFIVGEFGFQHGSDNQGNPIPIPFEVLLQESQRHGFGYIAWSWTGNSQEVNYLDMTARSGSAAALTGWGNDIVNGTNGIRETSAIASIFGQ